VTTCIALAPGRSSAGESAAADVRVRGGVVAFESAARESEREEAASCAFSSFTARSPSSSSSSSSFAAD
jgi:hypothetical protein